MGIAGVGIIMSNNRDLENDDMNFLDRIVEYEDGSLEWDDVVSLFQDLLNTGFILNLQGHYQRTCQALINAGEISYQEKTH
jgi:hypothetical protein